MNTVSRRTFLAASPAARVLGANDRVRVGLIGCGGRGRYDSRFMLDTKMAEVTALCDAASFKAEAARDWAGPSARVFTDYRKLVELTDLDAVVVATPDHWHSRCAVAALEAGKHVYVEKPFAYDIREGQAIVRAAAEAKTLLLPGTQHRSAEHYAEITAMVKEGLIGDVKMVRVWNYSNMLPNGIGRAADSNPPDGLNWDLYCGPAPLRPFNVKRFGPSYRWFRDYAGGMITDFGVHRFDTVHQIMGEAAGPLRISAMGGRYMLNDAGDMPDTMLVQYDYGSWVLNYEMSNISGHGEGRLTEGQRYYNARAKNDRPHGESYHGSKGTIVADRVGYEVWFDGDAQPARRVQTTDATSKHAAHFIACIQGREKPRATALTAHRATNVAHLGNLSYESRRAIQWDPVAEKSGDAGLSLGRVGRKPYDAFR